MLFHEQNKLRWIHKSMETCKKNQIRGKQVKMKIGTHFRTRNVKAAK